MTFVICSHFGSHSWTRTNDILINSQALYRLSYAGIFNFVLIHLCRLSFCRATLLPTPFPSLSFGSLRGNPSGAVPTQAMREYLLFQDIVKCQHLPIFPGRRHPSIFGAAQLNFCVRHGYRWFLSAISTGFLSGLCTLKTK